MKTVEPIYPELVEKIKAEYRAKIDAEPDETMKKVFQIRCDSAVAEEIGRQRKEAIEQGGELGERIKAENEALKKEMDAEFAKIDPKVLEEARRWEEEVNKLINPPAFCPNCGTPTNSGKFCQNCGTKLI